MIASPPTWLRQAGQWTLWFAGGIALVLALGLHPNAPGLGYGWAFGVIAALTWVAAVLPSWWAPAPWVWRIGRVLAAANTATVGAFVTLSLANPPTDPPSQRFVAYLVFTLAASAIAMWGADLKLGWADEQGTAARQAELLAATTTAGQGPTPGRPGRGRLLAAVAVGVLIGTRLARRR